MEEDPEVQPFSLPAETRDEIIGLCTIKSPIWSPEHYTRRLRDIGDIMAKLKPAEERKPK